MTRRPDAFAPLLSSLYARRFGSDPAVVTSLRADGSDRSIYRLVDADGNGVVGVHGSDSEENTAFLSFSRSLRSVGIPVPRIYATDEEQGLYLLEDLGDTTLFDALSAARERDGVAGVPEELVAVYERVVEVLPRIQVIGGRAIDYSVAYPHAEFDRQSMMWDLNYFKYHFLKLARIAFNEARLERDFERLCDFLLRADRTHFLYRDFQSRNVMLRPADPEHGSGEFEPWFIDYQGGRRGALSYDIASLLYDAKADLPDELRDRLLRHYMDSLANYTEFDPDEFLTQYRGYVLVRIMQAMGAYGYRGFYEGRTHFLASVPYAIDNVRSVLAAGELPVEMPELRAVYERIVEWGKSGPNLDTRRGSDHDRIAESNKGTNSDGRDAAGSESRLQVAIASFSYRNGYPEDAGGHGGGFVFDCRAIHNPGRYDDFRSLTGLDAEVIDFLEGDDAVETAFDAIATLVDAAVTSYLERGFDSLSVAFGCTGGQHRSVYFAERLARHLSERFPRISTDVVHQERHTWPTAIRSEG